MSHPIQKIQSFFKSTSKREVMNPEGFGITFWNSNDTLSEFVDRNL